LPKNGLPLAELANPCNLSKSRSPIGVNLGKELAGSENLVDIFRHGVSLFSGGSVLELIWIIAALRGSLYYKLRSLARP
jgi:hypothetical protein